MANDEGDEGGTLRMSTAMFLNVTNEAYSHGKSCWFRMRCSFCHTVKVFMLPVNLPAFNLSLPQRCQPNINRTVYMVSTLGRRTRLKSEGMGEERTKASCRGLGAGVGGQEGGG